MNGLGYVYGSSSDKASGHIHGRVCKECRCKRYKWTGAGDEAEKGSRLGKAGSPLHAMSASLHHRPGTPRAGAHGTGDSGHRRALPGTSDLPRLLAVGKVKLLS